MPYTKNLPPHKIRTPEVCQLTGLVRTTLWRMEQRGQFPKSQVLPGWGKVFNRSEVVAWLESRGEVTPPPAAHPPVVDLVAALQALCDEHGVDRVGAALSLIDM